MVAVEAMAEAAETDKMTSRLGKTPSDFTLETPSENEKSVHIDQVFFNLDAKRFKAFNALLYAPEAANPDLERLTATKPPWNDQPRKA